MEAGMESEDIHRPAGHNFRNVGAETVGDGSGYDLQYLPGGGIGYWGCGHYVEVLNYWSYAYRPGPATIDGVSKTMEGCYLNRMANVGDRVFVAISTNGFTDRIVYMQIVAADPRGITADAWEWNKT